MIAERGGLPWHVAQLGAVPSTGSGQRHRETVPEAAAAIDPVLDRYMHLAALNRGILMTPFHNMALVSPATTEEDIDKHTAVLEEAAGELMGGARPEAA